MFILSSYAFKGKTYHDIRLSTDHSIWSHNIKTDRRYQLIMIEVFKTIFDARRKLGTLRGL